MLDVRGGSKSRLSEITNEMVVDAHGLKGADRVVGVRGGSTTLFNSLLSRLSVGILKVFRPYLPKSWMKHATSKRGSGLTGKRYGSRSEQIKTTVARGEVLSGNNRIQKVCFDRL